MTSPPMSANPVARDLRERALADRRSAATIAVQLETVRVTIDVEMARYDSLRAERLSLLARAEDAEQTARDAERGERMRRVS